MKQVSPFMCHFMNMFLLWLFKASCKGLAGTLVWVQNCTVCLHGTGFSVMYQYPKSLQLGPINLLFVDGFLFKNK